MALQLIEISDITVSSPQASIDFTNIPQGYTDLKLIVSGRSNRALEADYWKMQFNGDTSANYFQVSVVNNISTVSSGKDTNNTSMNGPGLNANTATANTFSNQEIYIPNYTGNLNKVTNNNNASETNAAYAMTWQLGFNGGLWNNTAAITSIKFMPGAGTAFVANSTFTLYGVL